MTSIYHLLDSSGACSLVHAYPDAELPEIVALHYACDLRTDDLLRRLGAQDLESCYVVSSHRPCCYWVESGRRMVVIETTDRPYSVVYHPIATPRIASRERATWSERAWTISRASGALERMALTRADIRRAIGA